MKIKLKDLEVNDSQNFKVKSELGKANFIGVTSFQNEMPDLKNLTLREVQEQLQNRELKIKIHGTGRVSHFEPAVGHLLSNGDGIQIWLK